MEFIYECQIDISHKSARQTCENRLNRPWTQIWNKNNNNQWLKKYQCLQKELQWENNFASLIM